MLALAPQIQKLSFDHINGLDTKDMRSIGQYFTKLGKFDHYYIFQLIIPTSADLTLSNCTIARSISDPLVNIQSAEDGNQKPKLFNSLCNLVISSNISPSQVCVDPITSLFKFLLPVSCDNWPCLQTPKSPYRNVLLGLHKASLTSSKIE